MLTISEQDIIARLEADNPWWKARPNLGEKPYSLPRRDYFRHLQQLATLRVQRAIILLGSRRVGKTTMLRQLIGDAIANGHFPAILFVSIDTPTYTGLTLERLLGLFARAYPHDADRQRLVVFDEIQYLPDWERQLKVLVDAWPNTKFIASGSAGAALKRKSGESGAGRFTDFELPPLTFAEFLRFKGREAELIEELPDDFRARDIVGLNRAFVDYVNFGGYPEAVVEAEVQAGFDQFVGRDIVDKVLLRDLPSLYGIQDIQELNRLFQVLAYNTGQEVSLEALAQNSGVAKNTIQRYLTYLEAAFLIHRVRRIDDTARRFERQRSFKTYLTNPSMRAALFGPLAPEHPAFGALAETAALGQWIHTPQLTSLHYARWQAGEVDVVSLDPATSRPRWAYDVKWSDHRVNRPEELQPLMVFARRSGLRVIGATTRTLSSTIAADRQLLADLPALELRMFPLSLHCYTIGALGARQPDRLAGFLMPPDGQAA